MTERERQDAADTALMSQLFENLESGEDDSEELGEYVMEEDDDEDEDEDEDDEDEDTDEEEESDEDEEDDTEQDESLRARGLAWLGLTAQRSTRRLSSFPKLSSVKQEPLLHPAAQLLNMSSAAVNGKHCLSPVRAFAELVAYVYANSNCWISQDPVSA